MKTKSTGFILSFLLPTFIVYAIFSLYPIIQAFIISFYKWSGLSKNKKFVGLDNFKRLLSDEIILKAFWHNIHMLFFCTLFTFIIAIFFAAIITRKNYIELKFYRMIFLFPNILSIVIIGIIWAFIFNPSFGILNSMLKTIGLGSLVTPWLGDDRTVLGALIVPQVWISVGFFMILYAAGMQNIPKSLYEAADIDGASEIRKFFMITLPLLWEIIRISLVFFVTRAFNNTFGLVLVMTKGGPNRASELLTTYLYEQAFEFNDFGYGTAIGLLIFVIMMILTNVLLKLAKREVYEF